MTQEDENFALEELYSIFSFLNQSFFQKNIEHIDIGFCFQNKTSVDWNAKKKNLFFGSEVFFLTYQEFLISFLHEMIHIDHFQKDVKDVGTNSYHKRSFKDRVVENGLYSVKHKSQGWSIILTDLPRNVVEAKNIDIPDEKSISKRLDIFDQALKNFDLQKIYTSLFNMARNLTQEKKTYTYKYKCKCPPPFNSIRSGRRPNSPSPLQANCLSCGCSFIFEK